jgi:hypothetical protein
MKEMLLKELVMRDFDALSEMMENVPFNDAYEKLGGFNLSARVDINKFGIDIDAFFDFNFGCLNGTIYYGDDGSAVVDYKFDVWLKDITTPIANVTVADDEFNVNEWYN